MIKYINLVAFTFIFIFLSYYIYPYIHYYSLHSSTTIINERPEIFYEEKNYKYLKSSEKDPIKIKIDDFVREKPIFMKNSYSNRSYQFLLRPTNKYFSIPYQHTIAIRHVYQPVAKEIYDFIFISFKLPDFSVKNSNNIDNFIDKNNIDIINLKIGGMYLKNNEAENHLILINKASKVILDKKLSSDTMKVSYFLDNNSRAYYFAVLNPEKILSPSKQPLLAKCYTTHRLFSNCEVEFYLPLKFEGLDGIEVIYSFNPKYLYLWPDIHQKIISSISSYTSND